MEFLRAILGDDLFKQVENAINAHNGNEANKENQIKIGNLGGGEYTSTAKYNALNDTLTGKQGELDAANNLIAELQKAAKGNEDMQGKFTEYQNQVQKLQAELAETKIKSALKVALLSEKCSDVDYVSFKINEKLKEKGETLTLDENDNIKGWDDIISGMKTQLPTQFEKAGSSKVDPLPLPGNGGGNAAPTSLAEALQQQFETTK